MSDKREGIYDKYTIKRNDGADAPGHKHQACALFVLDVTHDPIARDAARAYAARARHDGFTKLADGLDAMVDEAYEGGKP